MRQAAGSLTLLAIDTWFTVGLTNPNELDRLYNAIRLPYVFVEQLVNVAARSMANDRNSNVSTLPMGSISKMVCDLGKPHVVKTAQGQSKIEDLSVQVGDRYVRWGVPKTNDQLSMVCPRNDVRKHHERVRAVVSTLIQVVKNPVLETPGFVTSSGTAVYCEFALLI